MTCSICHLGPRFGLASGIIGNEATARIEAYAAWILFSPLGVNRNHIETNSTINHLHQPVTTTDPKHQEQKITTVRSSKTTVKTGKST
jgi:hypothetical protein